MAESQQTGNREIDLAKIELEKERLRLEFERGERERFERKEERERGRQERKEKEDRELRKLELAHDLKMKDIQAHQGADKKDTNKGKTPVDFDLAKNVG